MTEREQIEHSALIARKAAAFDWMEAHKFELCPITKGWIVMNCLRPVIYSTALEAVEAAMKGTE